jgi:phytoene dehydrogenase-like protein
MSSGKKVLVCGAGWAGMHAAQLLQKVGFAVKVLEKADKPGGRIKSDVLNGFTIDYGFQVINPAYAELKESRALAGIEFCRLPKAVDIRIDARTVRIGDPRQNLSYLKGVLTGLTGTLREKVEFLRYLRRPTEDIDFGTALLETGEFFERVLAPFLTGVFLTNPRDVSNRMARELIHWFIKGSPGIPSAGVQQVSAALAAGLDIEYGVTITKLNEKFVESDNEIFQADYVVVALDPISTAKLLEQEIPKMNQSTTWYFRIPEGEISSDHLRIGGLGPVINSLVLSNIAPTYAPDGASLLLATTLGDGDETDVRSHLSYLWECETKDWELLTRIEIPNSLPNHPTGKELVAERIVHNGIYLAGDWLATPSQQGALVSGRRAANAIIAAQ